MLSSHSQKVQLLQTHTHTHTPAEKASVVVLMNESSAAEKQETPSAIHSACGPLFNQL